MTTGAQERADRNAVYWNYWYEQAVKRAELLRAEERRHGETIDKMNREKAAAVAQAVQVERERMRVLMDSIDTCPCDVCVDREPTNVNRARPTEPAP